MASPDHKAGLAVVVPSSGSRSPTQRKSKQHALNIPRNRTTQINGNTPPRAMNVSITPQQPTALPPARQSNGATFRRQSTGLAPFQPSNGTILSRPRLLNVDEALPFSPFSSVIPFSPGECFPTSWISSSHSARHDNNPKCQPSWFSAGLFYYK